jgi:hypothetical protein
MPVRETVGTVLVDMTADHGAEAGVNESLSSRTRTRICPLTPHPPKNLAILIDHATLI